MGDIEDCLPIQMADRDAHADTAKEARRLLREIADVRGLSARRQKALLNIDCQVAYLQREHAELVGHAAHGTAEIIPCTI